MIRTVLFFACSAAVVSSYAATFAVSTKIFVGSSGDPASEHRVLFDDGTAYDLSIDQGRFATIYDSKAGKVVLLDRQSKTQAIVTLDELLKITAQAKTSVTDPQERRRLGIEAKVVPDDDYRIEFAGARYAAKTQRPTDSSRATDYGRFADLALRMNILRPLGPPPFARMTLNTHIAAKGELPTESTLVLQRGQQESTYRSTNQIGELTEQDRQSIEQLTAALADYREIPWKDFAAPQ